MCVSSPYNHALLSVLLLVNSLINLTFGFNVTSSPLSPKLAWFLPETSVVINYDSPSEHQDPQKSDDSNPTYYAIQWPQDTISNVLNRVLAPGMSPFVNQSFVIYPDEILDGLVQYQQKKMSKKIVSDPPRNEFWKYYNPQSLLHYDTQMTIVAALSMFERPRALFFGSGNDSPLFCAAVTHSHEDATVVFVEDNMKWAEKTREILKVVSGNRDSKGRDRCQVWDVEYKTIVGEWARWIGRQEELTKAIVNQFPEGDRGGEFDVIVVDGPWGNDWEAPGRMASISTASALIRKDGLGVVFVDDFNRFVEMIYASYLLRPLLGHEKYVRGWGNTMNTVFFTRNRVFEESLML